MSRVFIALGANLRDPQGQLQRAVERLSACEDLRVDAVSPFYRTDPLGPPGQPDYCNAVLLADTNLPPLSLLQRLLDIERSLGKTRGGPRWGARSIDLDLLLYETLRIDTPDLKLPHPEMSRRNFVLRPLLDLAPEIDIPGIGSAARCLEDVGLDGIQPWR